MLILPLDVCGCQLLSSLVTPPLDVEESWCLQWSALLVTPPLGTQGWSPLLMVTSVNDHQDQLVTLHHLRGKGD